MTSCDVVVVGGGIAGVSVAYELAADLKVAVVEAEPELASHSTGRSAALFSPNYGPDVMRRFAVASRARFDVLAETWGVPPLLTTRPVLMVGTDAASEAAITGIVADQSRNLHRISTAEALTMCPVLRTDRLRVAVVNPSPMDINVMALHSGYVRGFKARGGTVLTRARMVSARRVGSGWRVDLADRQVDAQLLVNAAGAWVDDVAASAGVPRLGLQPMIRTAGLVAVHQPVDPWWPFLEDGAERFYAKPHGGELLISPYDAKPSPPCDAKPDHHALAAVLSRLNDITTLGITSVRRAWAGLRSFVGDGDRPVVGEWPHHPGFWFLAGQGGHGIQTAPALAATAAALISGKRPIEGLDVGLNDLSSARTADPCQ